MVLGKRKLDTGDEYPDTGDEIATCDCHSGSMVLATQYINGDDESVAEQLAVDGVPESRELVLLAFGEVREDSGDPS